MRKKLFLGCILFLGIPNLKAQSNSDASLSEEEAQLFSEIHQYKLDHLFDVVSVMKKNASKINISEKRMGEIMQAQFAGENIKISSEEQLELKKFQIMMKNDESKYKEKMDSFIKTKRITPSEYSEMEQKFQSSNALRERVNKKTRTN